MQLGYDDPIGSVAMAQEADRLGFHSVWTSEAWGADAVTVASWIAATTEQIGIGTAIMQMPARTPAMTAMTAATLDQLSGGRVLLGLGTSGPQVVEGWHGVPWGKPLGRTREYVEIVRAGLRRETLEHHGPHYDIPYSGEDATGLGKPLKLILKPLRREVPIYLAALGPKNVALAAEIADGWLPIFFSPYRFREIHGPSLEPRPEGFQIAPLCPVLVGDDVQQCRDMLKPMLALYIGGMGARGKNFYNSLTQRYGYEEAAAKIQELYLSGMKGEAAMTVPDELVDEIALVGPKERIAERLEAWREAGVSTLADPDAPAGGARRDGGAALVNRGCVRGRARRAGRAGRPARRRRLEGGLGGRLGRARAADPPRRRRRHPPGDALARARVRGAARRPRGGREGAGADRLPRRGRGPRGVRDGADPRRDDRPPDRQEPAAGPRRRSWPRSWRRSTRSRPTGCRSWRRATRSTRFYEELDSVGEPHPAIELGLHWVKERLPTHREPVVVHGDWRIGNIAVDEQGIVAVLDWEFAHLADPVEDLSWPLVRAWRFGADDKHLGGVGELDRYLDRYAELTGLEVTREELLAWEVFGNVKWATGCLTQSRRHFNGQERSVELAVLGRLAAEMEYELLDLIDHAA